MEKKNQEKEIVNQEDRTESEEMLRDFAELELERLKRGLEEISNYGMNLDSIAASIGIDKEKAEAIRAEMEIDKEIMKIVDSAESFFESHKKSINKICAYSLALMLAIGAGDEYGKWKEKERLSGMETTAVMSGKSNPDELDIFKGPKGIRGGLSEIYISDKRNDPEKTRLDIIDITEQEYQNGKISNRQMVEIYRLLAREHIKSAAYLKKLTKEYDGDEQAAREMQAKRIKNLDTFQVFLADLRSIDSVDGPVPSWVPEKIAYFLGDYFGVKSGLKGFYNPNTHIAVVQPDPDTILHELLHASTRAHEDISDKARNIIDSSFDPNGLPEKVAAYFGDPTERLVRKQIVDLFLDFKGIKKYEETLSKEHLLRLLDEVEGETAAAKELIFTSDPEEIEKFFNETADINKKKETSETV